MGNSAHLRLCRQCLHNLNFGVGKIKRLHLKKIAPPKVRRELISQTLSGKCFNRLERMLAKEVCAKSGLTVLIVVSSLHKDLKNTDRGFR